MNEPIRILCGGHAQITWQWIECVSSLNHTHTYYDSIRHKPNLTLSNKLTNRLPFIIPHDSTKAYRRFSLLVAPKIYDERKVMQLNEQTMKRQWNKTKRANTQKNNQTNKMEKLNYIKMLFMACIFLRNKFCMLMWSFMISTPVKV